MRRRREDIPWMILLLLLFAIGTLPQACRKAEPRSADVVAGSTAAEKVLAAGLVEADRTKRLVFLHSGASW